MFKLVVSNSYKQFTIGDHSSCICKYDLNFTVNIGVHFFLAIYSKGVSQ